MYIHTLKKQVNNVLIKNKKILFNLFCFFMILTCQALVVQVSFANIERNKKQECSSCKPSKEPVLTADTEAIEKADKLLTSAQQKYRNRNYQESLSDINKAIKFQPQSANAYVWRGFLKADIFRDYPGALGDLNLAIKIKPKDSNIYLLRGNIKAFNLQDAGAAIDDYDRAIQLNSGNSYAYTSRGTCKAKFLQNHRGALADFDRAILIDSQNPVAYENRAILKFNVNYLSDYLSI